MMEAQTAGDPLRPISPAEIGALCTAPSLPNGEGYAPSPKQVAFFVLAWASKQGCKVDQPQANLAADDGSLLEAGEVERKVQQVRQNLADWGAYVRQLQRKEGKAWELLRLQLERALMRYDCRLADKQDALGNAVVKVWELLLRMPQAAWIESFADGARAASAASASLPRLFDFTVPIFAYAGRIARNELVTILRRRQAPDDADRTQAPDAEGETPAQAGPSYLLDWDAILEGDSAGAEEQQDEVREQQAMAALCARLAQLLTAVEELPRRQRQVLQLTLGARAQFWRALEVLGCSLLPACAIVPLPPETDDAAIARRMDSTENLVRVTRHNAAQRIWNQERELGELLERLLQPGRAKKG